MYTKTIDIKSDGKGNEFYSVNYYKDGKYIGFDKVWTLNAAISVNLQVPAQLKRINNEREKHFLTFDKNRVYLTETLTEDRETVEISVLAYIMDFANNTHWGYKDCFPVVEIK